MANYWYPNSGPGVVGDVDGPASSTDGEIARFDGVTGKLLKDSGAAVITETVPTLTGSQSHSVLSINITNANHTGANNTLYGVNFPNFTLDAQCDGTAINVGQGWNAGMRLTGSTPIYFDTAQLYHDGTDLHTDDGFVTDGVLTAATLTTGANFTVDDAGALVTDSVEIGNFLTLDTTTINPDGKIVVEDVSRTQYSASIPVDDTIPQNTEGTQIFSQAIDVANASSKVLIKVSIQGAADTANTFFIIAAFRDSGADAIGASIYRLPSTELNQAELVCADAPGAAGSYTYSVRLGISSGSFWTNGNNTSRFMGGVSTCSLVLEEVYV